MTPFVAPDPAFGRAGVAAIAALVIVWEILGRLQLTIFIPSASSVALAWWGLFTDGTLFRSAGSSLASLLKGFVPAAVLGVALGLAMGRFRTLREVLDGWINAAMSAPLSALVPVLIALFGVRDTVVAATVFLFSFFVIVVNTMTGVRGTERSLVEMARSYGAREAALFARIYFPA
ncbi:MAG: ABC transporter permease, partial [Burkholderiales bacterium]